MTSWVWSGNSPAPYETLLIELSDRELPIDIVRTFSEPQALFAKMIGGGISSNSLAADPDLVCTQGYRKTIAYFHTGKWIWESSVSQPARNRNVILDHDLSSHRIQVSG